MESASRNGAVVLPDTAPNLGCGAAVAAAAALRWSRPDLTAALAEHVMEVASASSDRDGWLVAAGWRVHAVGATGDARVIATEVLAALPRWGGDALSGSASARLRLELAVLAHDAGEHGASRALLDGVSPDGRAVDAAATAEVVTARLRCRHDGGPADPADALAAWGRLGGAAGQIGAATVLLVAAATDRRVGRADSAVSRAVEGLARLERARSTARKLSPSPHLAAALSAEWLSALIGAGRPDQSRNGSRLLRERLVEYTRPTRQLALLRLTLARAAAEELSDGGADVAEELERAAHDAAASDAPELESLCRTALAEAYETVGRLEPASESVRRAVVAERRHCSRAVRFRAALAVTPGLGVDHPDAGAAPIRRPRPSGDLAAGGSAGHRAAGHRAAGHRGAAGHGANGHGADGNRPTGLASRGSGAGGDGVAPRRANGGATDGRARPASGRLPYEADPNPVAADEADPPATAPVDPWATGAWAAGTPPAPERTGAPAAGVPAVGIGPVHAPVPDPVASALADPEAWLTSALAGPDGVRGRRRDAADEPARDEPDPPAAAAAPGTGCVIVLDLTRGGGRLPAGAAASTVRRVARRLARQLPESAHLVRDRPDAVSVVFADAGRGAAVEWMHRVVPDLVDGLAVDTAAEGALLRAAVHDGLGMVGAQVLQRLDGGRTRPARGGTPGRARHAAPGLDIGSTAGGSPSGSVWRYGEDPEGTGPPRALTPGSGTVDSTVVDEAVDGPSIGDGLTAGGLSDGGVPDGRVPDGRVPDVGLAGGVRAGDATSADTDGGPSAAAAIGRAGGGATPGGATGAAGPPHPTGDGPTPAGGDPAAGPPHPTGDGPTPAGGDPAAGAGRHDEAAGRRPYLPDGVVVRPGTGGRRHRRDPDPPPDGPESHEASPAAAAAGQQSTDGLGLADLLAGALAAYRGI